VTPIAFGIQIAEIKLILGAILDGRHRARNLTTDKCLASGGPFVIEQNAI
jgi:hypothetical protein